MNSALICALLILATSVSIRCSPIVIDSDDYWTSKFPHTPMPKPIRDILPTAAAWTSGSGWENSLEVVIQDYGIDRDQSTQYHTEHCHNDIIASRFLLRKDLKIGGNVSVHLKSSGGISTRFPASINSLPGLEASQLGDNLLFFSVKPGSKASDVMNMTIRMCESHNPVNGKNQYCAASLEGLISYVNFTLGGLNDSSTTKVVYLESSTDRLLEYKFVSINPLATGTQFTLCHHLGFPYAVMRCHQPDATSAYAVQLRQVDDNRLSKAYVICHSQTREWSSAYIGFKILQVQPGAPICHFMLLHDLLWFTTSTLLP